MKYVAFYDIPEYKEENRSAFPSSVAVVSYMTEVFEAIDAVTIFSPARSLNHKGVYRGRKHILSDHVVLKLPMSWGTKSKIGRFFAVVYTSLWLFFNLLLNTQKGETVVAYHSMSTIGILSIVKRLKGIKLVEQVLEVYSDVNAMSERKKRTEYKHFSNADGFIFATELLNKKINKSGKPYVIAPATYKSEKIIAEKCQDGDIHVIYAGTLRLSKGGAVNAVKAAEYLPDNYRLHIVGYGGKEAIGVLKEEIQKIYDKNPRAKVSYDGLLYGDDFKLYLQKCHIGLSTQIPEGAYNESSFPSKIMTYLANGLEVVSVRIPAVETSPVGSFLHYYDEPNPENIAKAILSVDINRVEDKRELLSKLHTELIADLRILLKGN